MEVYGIQYTEMYYGKMCWLFLTHVNTFTIYDDCINMQYKCLDIRENSGLVY